MLAYQLALEVKNPPANPGDIRDVGFIPGQEDSLEEGMATHSSILAWRIPWTGEPGGLQPIGSQRIARTHTFPLKAGSPCPRRLPLMATS